MPLANGNGNKAKYLAPYILQVVGIGMLVASLLYWFLSGRQSVLMVSASLSLIGLGAYSKQVATLTQIASGVVSARADGGSDEPPA